MFSPCMRGFSPGTPASSHYPKSMNVRFLGVSKLSVGVSVSVRGPVMDWLTVQGVPRLSPNDGWDRLQCLFNLYLIPVNLVELPCFTPGFCRLSSCVVHL